MKKTLSFLMMALILLFPINVPIQAADNTGSIDVTIPAPDTPGAVNTNLEVYLTQVAEFAPDGTYTLMAPFLDANIDINDLSNTEKVNAAAKALEEISLQNPDSRVMAISDAEGKAQFSDVTDGLYLLYLNPDANYDQTSPVLIQMPEFSSQTHEAIRDITVTLKHKAKGTTPQQPQKPQEPQKPTPSPTPEDVPNPSNPTQNPSNPTQNPSNPTQNPSKNPVSSILASAPSTAAQTALGATAAVCTISAIVLAGLIVKNRKNQK